MSRSLPQKRSVGKLCAGGWGVNPLECLASRQGLGDEGANRHRQTRTNDNARHCPAPVRLTGESFPSPTGSPSD